MSLPPAAFDAILVSHFAHHFDMPTNVRILTRLAAALAPGGVLVLNDFVRDSGLYTPWKHPQPVQFSFTMLLTTEEGNTYSVEEYREMIDLSGMKLLTSQGNFPLPNSYIIAAKA